MNSKLDESLFYNARSSGMVIAQWKLTDRAKLLAFNIVNTKNFLAIGTEEINTFHAIEQCYHSEKLKIGPVNGCDMDQDTYAGACRGTTPWKEGKLGAKLNPELYQPWEGDDESYLSEHNCRFTITHLGEIAYERYLTEEARLLTLWKAQLALPS